ncbi:MAG: ParB/RepB/Spo0J family partition protein [Bacilli bacterium]|nr:ParB/RepB/Spo0J family partition protein [Bacilli bacterium]
MEQKKNIDLTTFKLDDFFSTQEDRDEDKKEKVEIIDLSLIDDFPEHPFKVQENEDLSKLKESIKDNGVLEPIIVRKKENNRYEIIAGHRRKFASELLGNNFIPCIVRDMTKEEAIVYMVDSNLHRTNILPSEKAKAYKMKMNALKEQGKRNDLTSSPLATKLDTATLVGKEQGESRDQVYRYIKLNDLIPKLLDMVDNSVLNEKPAMALRPAVEISYLSKDEQEMLFNSIEYSDATPSHAQAIKLRKESELNGLTEEFIDNLMNEEKPNQITKIKISENKIKSVMPKNYKVNNMEDFIVKAVEYYSRHLNRDRER